MIIVNKCGDKYCGHSRHQTQVKECRAAAPEGWNGLCPFQEYVPLKDFSIPNPREGTMVTKEGFRQYLIDTGFTCSWEGGAEIWYTDKVTMRIPLNTTGAERGYVDSEIKQCANNMVDLEAFMEYFVEKCKECGDIGDER